MTIKRVFELCMLVSLCLTVAYLAAAFTGQTFFAWRVVLVLALPVLTLAGYAAVVVISGVVFLCFLPSDYVSADHREFKPGILSRAGQFLLDSLMACVMILSIAFSYLFFGRNQPDEKDLY